MNNNHRFYQNLGTLSCVLALCTTPLLCSDWKNIPNSLGLTIDCPVKWQGEAISTEGDSTSMGGQDGVVCFPANKTEFGVGLTISREIGPKRNARDYLNLPIPPHSPLQKSMATLGGRECVRAFSPGDPTELQFFMTFNNETWDFEFKAPKLKWADYEPTFQHIIKSVRFSNTKP